MPAKCHSLAIFTSTGRIREAMLALWIRTLGGGGMEGTPLYGLYGEVQLERVSGFGLSGLNREYFINRVSICP